MNQLIQRKGFDLREFRFTDTKLYYNQGRFGSANEIDIPFENIDGERVSFSTSRTWLIALGCGFLVLGILSMIFASTFLEPFAVIALVFVFAALCVVLYFRSRRTFWKLKLKSEDFIYLYKDIPSRQETEDFLKDLTKARNNYLRENYLQIDENMDYEQQYYNLRWLLAVEAISKTEFDVKYDELKQTVNPEKTSIGFTK